MDKYFFDDNSNFIMDKIESIGKRHGVRLLQEKQESNQSNYIQYFQVLNANNYISYVIIIKVDNNIWLCRQIIESFKNMFAKYNFEYCENEFKYDNIERRYYLQFNSSDNFLSTTFCHLH